MLRPTQVWLAVMLAAAPARADKTSDALAHLDKGVLLYRAGNFAAAREELARSRDLMPDRPNPYRWLGLVDARLGHCIEAVSNLDAFLRLAPPDDERTLEARTARERCQEELRMKAAREAGAAGVPSARDLIEHANVHYNLGRYLEAAHEYEQVYEQRPDQTVLLYNIGQCYRQGGEPDKALQFYRSYLRTVPDPPNRLEIEGRIAALEKLALERRNQTPSSAPGSSERRAPPASAEWSPAPPPPAHDPLNAPPIEPTHPAPATLDPARPTTTPAVSVEPTPPSSSASAPVDVAPPHVSPPPALLEKHEPAPTAETGNAPRSYRWVWGVVAVGLIGAGVGTLLYFYLNRPLFNANLGQGGPPAPTGAIIRF